MDTRHLPPPATRSCGVAALRKLIGLSTMICLALATVAPSTAQTVLASGLLTPIKVMSAGHGSLVVCESGIGPNSGRVSRVSTDDGSLLILLDGLPSGIDSAGAPAGPTDMVQMSPTRWFLLLGEGDAVVNTDTPGVQAPNQSGPSSPIVSSILELDFSSPVSQLSSTFQLTLADHFTLADGHTLSLANGEDSVRISLVEDFRDLVPDPFTGVRASNSFAMARRGNNLYVIDSGLNQLSRVRPETRRYRKLVGFSPLPNPLPFGPPVLDAVPTSVRSYPPNRLLVTLFTGFPFPAGSASVVSIDLGDGSVTPVIEGLTTAIDVLPVPHSRGREGLLVLEFSGDLLAEPPASGRLLRFDGPGAPPEVLAAGLLTPTSIAYEGASGRIFITELVTGSVVEIDR